MAQCRNCYNDCYKQMLHLRRGSVIVRELGKNVIRKGICEKTVPYQGVRQYCLQEELLLNLETQQNSKTCGYV